MARRSAREWHDALMGRERRSTQRVRKQSAAETRDRHALRESTEPEPGPALNAPAQPGSSGAMARVPPLLRSVPCKRMAPTDYYGVCSNWIVQPMPWRRVLHMALR